MTRQALFATLVADDPSCKAELAKQLGWSPARVAKVLSGEGQLTIATVHAVARALGQTFDVVFRRPEEGRVAQVWERACDCN